MLIFAMNLFSIENCLSDLFLLLLFIQYSFRLAKSIVERSPIWNKRFIKVILSLNVDQSKESIILFIHYKYYRCDNDFGMKILKSIRANIAHSANSNRKRIDDGLNE